MNTTAIMAAVRGVLLGELGSVRVIAAGTFAEGPPAAHIDVDDQRWILARGKPRFHVEMELPSDNGGVGGQGSRGLLDLPITIVLTYPLNELADIANGDSNAVKALAASDVNDVVQALTWAGNLVVDGSSTATGLVSGMLLKNGKPSVRREDWRAGVYEIAIPFRGIVDEERAVA